MTLVDYYSYLTSHLKPHLYREDLPDHSYLDYYFLLSYPIIHHFTLFTLLAFVTICDYILICMFVPVPTGIISETAGIRLFTFEKVFLDEDNRYLNL